MMRVLYVDLENCKVKIKEREDLVEYFGGTGLACRLFLEEMAPNKDPLDPEQPIVFAIGPLSTIFPVVTKVVAVFHSPLTGEYGESHAGGRLAMAMRYAGYDAVVIKGRAKRPTYLSIGGRHVEFKDAEPLWGLNVEETGRWLREIERGRGFRSSIRIGPAGENLVRYAGVNVDTFRHFGRLGLGANFGSKMLKGIVFIGDQTFRIPDNKQYLKVYREIFKKTIETDLMKKYHELGTAVNVKTLNQIKALPTYNMKESTFERADEMSGEAFAKENLFRKLSCIGCPIGCIHIALLRKEFASGFEYTSEGVPYDYEPIFSMGSYLGISNKEDILTLLDDAEKLGVDVISAGNVLGWTAEAYEKGLVSAEDLGVELRFGEAEGFRKVLENIVKGKNELYRDLAKGVYFAGKKYGGFEFAMNLGKNEMPGYYTGYSFLIGITVGARHSHLDNAGYSHDQEITDIDAEEIAGWLLKEEKWRNVLTSLCICLFARKIYDEETIIKALNSIGIKWTKEQLYKLGDKIFQMKLEVKEKLGYDWKGIEFPERFFQTECVHGVMEKEKAREILDLWIKKAGIE
jgi:aldehyde:ferredoxin oxidoreductase